ncbi:TIGR03862 family flavoprotein [Octadecabacter sp. 1_MG-2023]|uniref:TIGR03862 family flavoprotein n=1 Tax=unclassified Octadecabacter TaxID=196158 RepID=UPI001C09FE4B|nr:MULTISPECIES: TIGR03862 family flavoprotein [unclassified Octadecabacter]MBU2992172.1 TIGR03862 family flavoprotein [Octadecabacter sp. B2R22]MDO6735072.1 TIGR03862 family flavoprotein [Octadecabacter sp. 1_MG-2023]
MSDALVIGGGPAGLMAADVLSAAGHSVVVADAMPTMGRKFLMAGKSGLNLTKAEPLPVFKQAYGAAQEVLSPMISAFGPNDVSAWAEALGQTVFTGSTARVFPTVMKASPLLRAWLAHLSQHGVRFETHWRWTGWDGDDATFDTPDGPITIAAKVTVLALGGASWSRLGSNGQWAGQLPDQVAPFKPVNMGFEVSWSDHMTAHLGAAVKGCKLTAGERVSRGEFVVSSKGLEGGGIYSVSAAMRDGAPLVIDLLPDMSVEEIATKLAAIKGKQSVSNKLRKALKLDSVKRALLNEFGRNSDLSLHEKIKGLTIPQLSPRPIDEAISTAGGVRFDALTDDLMLKSREGVYCVGEMLDWAAPTGGYLINGCLATGRWAGLAAAHRLQTS